MFTMTTDTEEHDMGFDRPEKVPGVVLPTPSYAEITMKSGAVVTFECVSLSFERSTIATRIKWEVPDGAARRPVMIDPDEIAAAIFVDGTAR